jgi:hypothetical protein
MMVFLCVSRLCQWLMAMSIDLKDYHEQLDALDRTSARRSRRELRRGRRVMSRRRRLQLAGRRQGLSQLGRGQRELVITYIQAMPSVAKEVGEEVIQDCIVEAAKLASMVSGSHPCVRHAHGGQPAGDTELLRGYLELIVSSPRYRATCARYWRIWMNCFQADAGGRGAGAVGRRRISDLRHSSPTSISRAPTARQACRRAARDAVHRQ